MKIDIITALPDFYKSLNLSLIGKAQENNLVNINIINLYDFGIGIHKSIDDSPYGGGSGMVLMPEVAKNAIDSVLEESSILIIPTARGYIYDQTEAKKIASAKHLVFLNSRFEGYDERIVDYYIDKGVAVLQYSIGDYILFGSDVATQVILETSIRLLPGVLGNSDSLVIESFCDGLLEHNSYTRPKIWKNLKVPEVLLGGNHKKIDDFRLVDSQSRTKKYRPDLFE
ncbi:MAG: tRNA (guanosine(37)-N1)-methyltransferase TrmD [Bifidobacteriaceae bacterium]|jgi:tRNA (guanine37-N1)-methyltransferase|nr:tRNA (guanosine(37)-N1)-methyltransferase TrmD [Bifidobacteriaceae bacterium]